MGRIAMALPVLLVAGPLGACGGSNGDPCRGVSCSSRGVCVADQGAAWCACIPGFHPVEQECVENDAGNPCLGIDCGGHGTCRADGTDVTCECVAGFRHLEESEEVCATMECDLLCVPVGVPDGGGDAPDSDGACAPPRMACLGVCVDPQTDEANCGECGILCDPFHAAGTCTDGLCLLACESGWVDANGVSYDGCEYECTRSAAMEERGGPSCEDGADNDCDGRTDAADPDCADCVPEFCDGDDDDCDGLTDETFDFDFDPFNCGACGNACPARPHAAPACVLDECALACAPGWSDDDGLLDNGCEASCSSGDMAESICNGEDDDCDGRTDEDFVPASTCGSGLCVRDEVCARGVVTCRPRTPPAATDTTCDGLDDDCDGSIDEEADCTCTTAADCDDGNSCTTDECGPDSLCRITASADGTPCPGGSCCAGVCAGSGAEICNGVDDDCDTACDESFGCCRGAVESCTGGGGPGVTTCGSDCTRGPCVPTGDPCNGADDDGDTTCDTGFACCLGASESSGCPCGGSQSRTCGAGCVWSGWSGCSAGTCVPSTVEGCMTGCGLGGTRTCTGSCTWGGCDPPSTAYRCPSGGAVYGDRGSCDASCSETADCSCSTTSEYFRVAGGTEYGCECAPGDPPDCECMSFCWSGSCPCGAATPVGSPPSGSSEIGYGCDSYWTGATFYRRDTTTCSCPLGSASCDGSPSRCTVSRACDTIAGC
jgi:hypothetical protein